MPEVAVPAVVILSVAGVAAPSGNVNVTVTALPAFSAIEVVTGDIEKGFLSSSFKGLPGEAAKTTPPTTTKAELLTATPALAADAADAELALVVAEVAEGAAVVEAGVAA